MKIKIKIKKIIIPVLLLFVLNIQCNKVKAEPQMQNQIENKIQNSNESGSTSSNEIYRDRMRELITKIRNNTSQDKILITQNGNELYYKNGKLNTDFFNVTNGTTQEDLYYGADFKLTKEVPKKENEELLKILLPIRQAGKPIFGINYGKGTKARTNLANYNKKTGILNELIPSFGAEIPNEPIQGFNSENINSLNDAKNFLLLLDPKKFKDIDDYFRYLKNTDYDLLLIETSHDGKFFTKEQIAELKTKKNGGKRIVISYFSIGEAGDYRSYWKDEWKKNKPNWIVKENKDWKGDYIVKYWSDEWWQIVAEYQKNLDEIGVDGYMLDTVDTFQSFEN